MLSVLRFTDSVYPFDILKLFFWPLYCLSFELRLLITHLLSSNSSFSHCIVSSSSIYGFWIPFSIFKLFFWPLYRLSLIYAFWFLLWYLQTLRLVIVSSVLWFTPSDFLFGIFKFFLWSWPLYCLFFFDLRILISSLVSSNYSLSQCIVSPSLIYGFWLPPFISFGHCIVCPSSIYGFWLSLWYLQTLLLAIVLSVFSFTHSDYRLVSSNSSFEQCIVSLIFTAFDYVFGILNFFSHEF